MIGFSESFLLFLLQIAAGGLFALAGTPFHQLDRAFYKSTAGVLYVIAAVSLWGQFTLFTQGKLNNGIFAIPGLLSSGLFLVAFSCYLFSLWTERQLFRARSFTLALMFGLLTLILISVRIHQGSLLSAETMLFPLSCFVSALLLGSVTVGMLLGHWYLIDTGQTLEPFIRMYRFFVGALIAQGVLFILAPGILYFVGDTETVAGLYQLWRKHATLFVTRTLVGEVGPLVLSYMIWRTLQIPHTMAATGLFYIALLGVFVGEILGKQILALTALPF